MPQSRDDDEQKRPAGPGDHLASRSSAFRSEELKVIVTRMLVVERKPGESTAIGSMLRSLLGRETQISVCTGSDAVADRVRRDEPEVIVWYADRAFADQSVSALEALRSDGFAGRFVVISDEIAAMDAARLRAVGDIDIVEKDDLDSVHLSRTLLKVAGESG